MKKQKLLLSIFTIFLLSLLLAIPIFSQEKPNNKYEGLELYVGGMPFGAKIISNGLTVVKFSQTQGENASSAYIAGLREGDIIIKINGIPVNTIDDYSKLVNKNGGEQMKITVLRNKQELTFNVYPKYSNDDGRFKTGIWVKDSTSGIGTITYINPETNEFGGLGHGICDSSNGKIIPLNKGIVTDVTINGVTKGQIGVAGELKGTFKDTVIGSLKKNTPCGVFGKLLSNSYNSPEHLMKICPKKEVKEGDAYIWCTLGSGKPEKYKISIVSIDSSNSTTKNFKIKITDQCLLEKSGGIVQGMSGSPVIQDGRLVGAVTHVLINDPTEGYGIFIENMLDNMN